jgi:caffeoyl-CoA O-methyltransferase
MEDRRPRLSSREREERRGRLSSMMGRRGEGAEVDWCHEPFVMGPAALQIYRIPLMKAGIDKILKRPQAEYLDSLLPPRDALLARVEEYAAQHGHPIADPEVAQAMRVLLRAKRPRRLVEVGTNIGYSVIVMGREVGAGAAIDTIELDSGILSTARGFVAEASLQCEVRFHLGAALEVLPQLEGPVDFAFIDCVKTEYEAYLDQLLPKLERGAMIVCDNVLWKGRVAEDKHDEPTDALRAFNRRLVNEPRLTTTVLAVGDGLSVSIVG